MLQVLREFVSQSYSWTFKTPNKGKYQSAADLYERVCVGISVALFCGSALETERIVMCIHGAILSLLAPEVLYSHYGRFNNISPKCGAACECIRRTSKLLLFFATHADKTIAPAALLPGPQTGHIFINPTAEIYFLQSLSFFLGFKPFLLFLYLNLCFSLKQKSKF